MDNRSVIDRLYEYNEIEQTRDRNTEGSSEIDKLY